MTAPRTSRHCDELGECQDRTMRCDGCPLDTHRLNDGGFFFAPGSIEEHRRPSVLRAWLHVAAILAVLALAGFVSGIVNGAA